MITDFLTRLWPDGDPFAGRPACSPADQHRRDTDAHDEAGSVVVAAFRSERMGLHVPVDALARRIGEDPARLVGFGAIDPLAASLDADLARLAELHIAGIVISPADQGCRPTHHRCRYVLEWAAARGVPVLVSNPGLLDPRSIMEFARPSLFDEACRELPALRLILGDLGHAWRDEALLMCARHERVFAEISTVVTRPAALAAMLTEAHEIGVSRKIFFASGSPACCARRAAEAIYALAGFGREGSPRCCAPRSVLREIIERDSLASVGIERPARARGTTNQQDNAVEAAAWN